jgi:hypothetical protein
MCDIKPGNDIDIICEVLSGHSSDDVVNPVHNADYHLAAGDGSDDGLTDAVTNPSSATLTDTGTGSAHHSLSTTSGELSSGTGHHTMQNSTVPLHALGGQPRHEGYARQGLHPS